MKQPSDNSDQIHRASATPNSERTELREFIERGRRPVNAIIVVGEILERSDLTPDQQECLAVIISHAQTLKRLFEAAEEVGNYRDRPREELQVLNYRRLLNRTGDKIAVAEEVLAHIHKSLPEQVSRCREALDLNNIEELRQVAHTIKGSAGTAGAEIVADRAGRISRTIRNDVSDRAELVSVVEELEDEAKFFLDLLARTDRCRLS